VIDKGFALIYIQVDKGKELGGGYRAGSPYSFKLGLTKPL
jgi:hypothetical protein